MLIRRQPKALCCVKIKILSSSAVTLMEHFSRGFINQVYFCCSFLLLSFGCIFADRGLTVTACLSQRQSIYGFVYTCVFQPHNLDHPQNYSCSIL